MINVSSRVLLVFSVDDLLLDLANIRAIVTVVDIDRSRDLPFV